MIDPQKVDKSIEIISRRTASYEYFFNNLDNPDWIRPLKEKGFFSSPPPAIVEENSIRFPIWPESRFLLRVVDKAPILVSQIAMELPETDNIRVHEDFTEAACKMPGEMAAIWAKKESKWIIKQQHLYLNLPIYLGNLIDHLVMRDQITEALILAKALFYVRNDPDYDKKLELENEVRKENKDFLLPYSPHPQAKYEQFLFEGIIQEKLPALVEKGGMEAFNWLSQLLKIAIKLSLRTDESHDFSYIWRPAIEDHEQNRDRGLKDSILVALRKSAERLIRKEPNKSEEIINSLLSQADSSYSIFQRISLYLMRLYPENQLEKIFICLTDKSLFGDADFHHEYWMLAKERLGDLTQNQQHIVSNWYMEQEEIERKEYIKRYVENHNAPPHEERIREFTYNWLRDKLSPIQDYLPANIKERYKESIKKLGESTQPEFSFSVSTGFIVSSSPKSSEDIQTMSFDELFDYLNSWKPSNEWGADSRDGLALEIASVVGENPKKFDKFVFRVIDLHPVYVRGFVSGFQKAVNEKNSFRWEPVLNLCTWIVNQKWDFPKKYCYEVTGGDREENTWSWTWNRIAYLIEDGIKEEREVAIDFKYREKVWDIIKMLTNAPEPTLTNEKEMVKPFDAAALSINVVRGVSMHAAIYYGFWVMRNIEKLKGTAELDKGFKLMPELRDLLELKLDRRVEKTQTILSVYGKWFPWIVTWDDKWARKYRKKVFPTAKSLQEYWNVSWGTYLVYNKPYNNVYRCLKSEYKRALRNLKSIDIVLPGANSADECLSEHIMIYFWQGLISMRKGDLVTDFFMLADKELRGHAIYFIGDSLKRTFEPIPSTVINRLKRLWNWRFKIASNAKTENRHELEAFGTWFGSGKFDDKWVLGQLLSVLLITKKVEGDERIVERLAKLAIKFPKMVLECFHLMIEGEPDGYRWYLWRDPSKTLLINVLKSTNIKVRESAVDLIHRLGAMGRSEYKDLLP